jgi:hypothetical protein
MPVIVATDPPVACSGQYPPRFRYTCSLCGLGWEGRPPSFDDDEDRVCVVSQVFCSSACASEVIRAGMASAPGDPQ